ncbi:50S ribosomal protein L23 [Candidatus Woesebacteria bacterium RBG_16_34_12]|uniref:50S ribosomal protein L23 n=1 Tax=Candidatus Woesebacteria bacterium RBG_16_34_12 TaxID=1802480 RepID=A0A1F7X997_9BACT|nr:MAG: 50S ribosomal protein L23 [Candidatus Woesebacteria bacterium RBG_16_34_12]
MKLEPILTEKSLEEAKKGKYSFWIDKGLTKSKIRKTIGDVFGVTVKKVRTVNFAQEIKKTYLGRKKIIKPRKKAIVTLAEKEKIDLFETKK